MQDTLSPFTGRRERCHGKGRTGGKRRTRPVAGGGEAARIMTVRMAVVDPLPMFQRGIMVTLGEARFDPEAAVDLLGWAQREPPRVVLLSLLSSSDWVLLAELRKVAQGLLTIAVLTDASTTAYVRAVMSGAAAVLPRNASVEMVRQVVDAVVAGQTLLPVEVVQALADHRNLPAEQGAAPSAREVEWLRALATGVTVANMAARFGYSERAMFRLLRDLYERMQVGSRTEALMKAQEQGWL
jgi:DNA-binding NarL/FixJ family response regulator